MSNDIITSHSYSNEYERIRVWLDVCYGFRVMKSFIFRNILPNHVDRLQRQEAEWEGVDCILLVQGKNQWRALAKTAVMPRIQ
jgi:hypothetical protein